MIAPPAFAELLAQYGFLSREAYEQAHLPKAEREGLAKALDKLSQLKENGTISRTVYSNMFTFITECLYRKWDVVRDELGKATFSQKYRDCKKLLNYDVKIECPKTMSDEKERNQ